MKLSNKPLAMAYVPWQEFENVLEAGCGLKQGTIFEDLIYPFVGSQAACQAVRPQYQQPAKPCGCSNNQSQNYSYGRRCGCEWKTK